MNLLVTLNRNYWFCFMVMLDSFIYHHQEEIINLYVVSNDVSQEELKDIKKHYPNLKMNLINYHNDVLAVAKTTYRYPPEVYTRLYAIEYLPDTVDKILYLDPDIIILKKLQCLYEMDFEDNYYIGSSNIKKALTLFNNWKNKAQKDAKYLNTGVLMINVKKMRQEQNIDELNDYIIKNEKRLFLPDQDVLNALYGTQVKVISHLQFNLSDRALKKYNLINKIKIDQTWIDENAYIIHYYGKNKPWKPDYKGILKHYYDFHAERVSNRI